MSCGADSKANELIESLTADESFEIPDIDFSKPEFQFPFDPEGPLYKPVPRVTTEELTTRTPGGTGVFDALMDTFRIHLLEESERGRITGAEYVKTYISLADSAMNQAAAFLLGRDQSFWQAQNAQINAMTARIQLETAKVQLAATQFDAQNRKASFAATKMDIAIKDNEYCISKFNIEKILPTQYDTALIQMEGSRIANETASYQFDTVMPMQTLLLTEQLQAAELQNNTATFTLSDMIPQQLKNLRAQETLLREQMEAQRGQTMDMRSDNIPVTGVQGRQKSLYTQQVTSYQRDAEVKAAKIFSDAWITQKTIDEGLLPPNAFNNASVDQVLQSIKSNNGLGS